MWILSDSLAIAARRIDSEDYFIKDIVLLKNGFLKDSIDLRSLFERNDYFLGNVQAGFPVSHKELLLSTGRQVVDLIVERDKLIVRNISKVKKKKEFDRLLFENSPEDFATYMTRYGDYIIGYEREKFKMRRGEIKRMSKNDWENFPVFWISRVDGSVDVTEKIEINESLTSISEELFFDYKDWDKAWSRLHIFDSYYLIVRGNLFFIVNRANSFYRVDLGSMEIVKYDFPEVRNNEACFLFFDHLSESFYVAKKSKDDRYSMYFLNLKSREYTEVGIFADEPQAVINHNVHVRRKIPKEAGEDFDYFCHYLLPIYGSNDAVNILNKVDVKN
jgi:hypothetical protein